MNGFVGEFLILLGAFRWDPQLAAFAATGVILSAVYMLWMFQRVNYGRVTNEKNRTLPDLTPREWAMMVPTIAMAIVMGVLPNLFLRPMEPSVKRTIERVTGRISTARRRRRSLPDVRRERRCAIPSDARDASGAGQPSRQPRAAGRERASSES